MLFGGGETTDLNAARYLKKRGHCVTLITASPLLGGPNNVFDDISVIYVNTPWLRNWAYRSEKMSTKVSAAFYHLDNFLFEISVFRWLVKQPKGSFDIVHMCSLFRLPGRIIRYFGYPCVSWLPGPPSRLVRRKIKALIQYKNFAMFTRGAPESALVDMGLRKGYEYEIIEPGVELSVIDQVSCSDTINVRTRLGLTCADLLGVTTARLVPIKNHELLLEAIAIAKDKGVMWNWAFAGDGPLEDKLQNRAHKLGIESQTHWLGHQSKSDIYSLLRSCDLFALTSSYENFSNAVLEALAHKKPVIGTQVGYLQYLIADSKGGIVVPPSSPKLLADALLKMSDLEVRIKFGADGRIFVERLNWPKIAMKLEKLYERLCTR